MERLHAIKKTIQKHTRGELLDLTWLWDAFNADFNSIEEAVAQLKAEAEEAVENLKRGYAYAGESLEFLEKEAKRLKETPPHPRLGASEICIEATSYAEAKRKLALMEVTELLIARYEALIDDLRPFIGA